MSALKVEPQQYTGHTHCSVCCIFCSLPRSFILAYFVPEDSLAATTDTWRILTEALIFRKVKGTIAGRPIRIDYMRRVGKAPRIPHLDVSEDKKH